MSVECRIIICGSRPPKNLPRSQVLEREARLWTWMSVVIRGLRETYGHPLVIVHGAARGVDQMAEGVCRSLGITTDPFPADWDGRGRIAGFERNQRMLDSGAIGVVAFKHPFNWALDRGGTEDMVRRAKAASVPTYVIEGPI